MKWGAGCAALLFVTATGVDAQTVASRSRELAVGLVWSTPVSLGQVSADLTAPGGAPFVLFEADSDIGPGLGFEVSFLERLTERIDLEVSGAWTKADVRTRISADFEEIDDIELVNRLTRFTMEGGVLWRVAERDQAVWFVRGSGGWLRELDEESALAENGFVINAGGGVRYWFQTGTTTGARMGVRVEGRLTMRKTGSSFGDELRVGPALTAAAVFRF